MIKISELPWGNMEMTAGKRKERTIKGSWILFAGVVLAVVFLGGVYVLIRLKS